MIYFRKKTFMLMMFLIYVLLICYTHGVPLNMYNTKDRQDGYCLFYDAYRGDIGKAYQIIPYCLRSLENVSFNIPPNSFDGKFNLIELRNKNVSSSMLLSWSSSIDLAEEYQIYLNNLSLSFQNEIFFYNCTSPWFGPFCLFAFDTSMNNASFNQIVKFTFRLDPYIGKYPSVTCYEHLHCGRESLCLDWREICDRKMDCLDGSDEFNCWQLEMNECNLNEYRCQNGECIPLTFFHDDPNDPDCTDRTDEPVAIISKECAKNPAFDCEEHRCRPGEGFFPCGDGECTFSISGCRNNRDTIIIDKDFCSKAMACITRSPFDISIDVEWCKTFCPDTKCIQDNCSLFYSFPSRSIAFGHVRFVYKNEKKEKILLPDYICYDENLCENFYPGTININGSTCRHLSEFKLKQASRDALYFLARDIREFFNKYLLIPNEIDYCNHSIMYQCFNSRKCISKHRLVDGIQDCPLNDDETFNQSCELKDANQRFKCIVDNSTKCFAPLILLDAKYDCQNEEDEVKAMGLSDQHIYFQTICDTIEHLLPQLIDGRNETDETECENWPCNNTYTRCIGVWSCKDGADDINCPSSSCPQFEHGCVFPNDTSKVSCLSITRAGDGIVDCLGATDERTHCQSLTSNFATEYFQCWNDTRCVDPLVHLCDSKFGCPFKDDEIFCKKNSFLNCRNSEWNSRTEVENFLCELSNSHGSLKYFRLKNMPIYPVELTISHTLSTQTKNKSIRTNSIVQTTYIKERRCNRGISIQIRTFNNTPELSCLCPPSYYGDKCQYQNERVSLTLQIRVILEQHTIFTLIITLFDDERNIESFDQIEYLSIRDCDIKFHLYLLYSTRPKNSSKIYSIQIDLFNKKTLEYRFSWILPVRFNFLPVYHQSALLKVPTSDVKMVERCQPSCIHGLCLNYINDQKSTFCQCFPGWSGIQCNIEYKCECALGSRCIGKSICLCPLDRYGPRCHLLESSCNSKSCVNGGQCVSRHEHHISEDVKRSTCICPEKYTGDRCEVEKSRIDILFDSRINIPAGLFIHFITVENKSKPIRTSIRKKIAYDQNSLTLYTSISFNLAFAQLFHEYYLIILREKDIISTNIFTQISPYYQCRSINELFNETVRNLHLLRRIKSYHIPCKQRLELVCFYDEAHFCLCDLDRHANCFEFNHTMTYDCDANNYCENGGECFEDDPKCPTSSICVCLDCYYGSRCQFSTRGSTLSLDVILGYQIRPNIGINGQSQAVKAGIALSIITLVLGLVSSLLSAVTFQMKKCRDVGCGVYLLASSVTSMFTMIILTMKFWFLLAAQIGSITDRSFIYIQCVSIDYFLRLLLSIVDWLSACVAIERTVTVLKGVKFDKRKSKRIAKWIILIILIMSLLIYIHDPIHRDLIDDDKEKRTWCVTKYSLSLQYFDWSMNIFHYSVPLLINLISALIIIISAARSRSNTQKNESYKKLLREQLKYHKHLLISPFIVLLLSLPRVIISLLSGCMKSARNPWLYLTGYFLSFTPSMLTFVIFVLPSKIYKQQFTEYIQRFWNK